MENLEKKFAEASAIIKNVKNDADAEKASAELYKKFADCNSTEELTAIAGFVLDGLKDLQEETDSLMAAVTLQDQLASYKEILPMSYIARNYFGKSVAWLQQRINGYPVRGKIYTLKPAEVEILNHAIHDIGNRLGSLSVHC